MITDDQYKALADGWKLRHNGRVVHLFEGKPCYQNNVPLNNYAVRFEAFEIVPDEDGYLPWYGGKNPAPGKRVGLVFRDGSIGTYPDSDTYSWRHGLKSECHNEIVKYRPFSKFGLSYRLMTNNEVKGWLLHTSGAVFRERKLYAWHPFIPIDVIIHENCQRAIMDEKGNVSQITDCYIEEAV